MTATTILIFMSRDSRIWVTTARGHDVDWCNVTLKTAGTLLERGLSRLPAPPPGRLHVGFCRPLSPWLQYLHPMAVVPALATAETSHNEDENEHPKATGAETAQRLWNGNRALIPSGAPKDEPSGTTGLFSRLAVGSGAFLVRPPQHGQREHGTWNRSPF